LEDEYQKNVGYKKSFYLKILSSFFFVVGRGISADTVLLVKENASQKFCSFFSFFQKKHCTPYIDFSQIKGGEWRHSLQKERQWPQNGRGPIF